MFLLIQNWLPNTWHIYKGYIIILCVLFFLKFGFIRFYKRRKTNVTISNFILGINNLYYVLFLTVLFFLILRFFGITIREFFTSIAIVAAALAIVFRDYIVNGLNGMVLIIGDNLRLGDYVKIGKQRGIVKNISLVAVHLQKDNHDLVLIPNNFVVSNEVINYTKNKYHSLGIDFTLPISKSLQTDVLNQTLIKKVNEDGQLIDVKTAHTYIESNNEMVINYSFQYNLLLNTDSNNTKARKLVWEAILLLIHN